MAETLGARLLASWRRKAKISQTTAAALLGVSQSRFSDWERGLGRPDIDGALTLESVAGVPIRAWARRQVRRRKGAV
jgi:transcriptional regulator with XRE-family HTH domain